MITHLVLFKLKDRRNAEKARDVLLGMRSNIPQLRHLGFDLASACPIRRNKASTMRRGRGMVKKYIPMETRKAAAAAFAKTIVRASRQPRRACLLRSTFISTSLLDIIARAPERRT
ncbi:hypothetical protein ig2599ANME_1460 [groundwater metagenome]